MRRHISRSGAWQRQPSECIKPNSTCESVLPLLATGTTDSLKHLQLPCLRQSHEITVSGHNRNTEPEPAIQYLAVNQVILQKLQRKFDHQTRGRNSPALPIQEPGLLAGQLSVFSRSEEHTSELQSRPHL